MAKNISIEGAGDLIPIKDFIEYCNEGYFIDYDGSGYFSDGETYNYDNSIGSLKYFVNANPTDFDFDYVLWFNK